jgi:hypothetical protein
MVNRNRLIKGLTIVTTMIVWMGCGQHQGAPKPAGNALQTSLECLVEENSCFFNFHHIHPNENWQQRKEVALRQFPSAVKVPCSDFPESAEMCFCHYFQGSIVILKVNISNRKFS